MNKIYAGIGSRKSPKDQINVMIKLAQVLGKARFILRSGGADGADLAFEYGASLVKGPMEIYLPWKKFNNNTSTLFKPTEKAMEIAAHYHPAWDNCKPAVRKLMARNTHQVLGQDCKSPADFVICWTENKGGTLQALRIAKDYGIPIFNLYEGKLQEVKDFIKNYIFWS